MFIVVMLNSYVLQLFETEEPLSEDTIEKMIILRTEKMFTIVLR